MRGFFDESSIRSLAWLFFVLGMFAIGAALIIHVFSSPPVSSELRPVSGRLAEEVRVIRPPKGSSWALLDLLTPEGKKRVSIFNVGFLWKENAHHPLHDLKPGMPVTVFTAPGSCVAWEIRTGGVTVLPYSATREAEWRETRLMVIVGSYCAIFSGLYLLWARKKNRAI